MPGLIPYHANTPEPLHAHSVPQHWPLVFKCAKNLGARNFIGGAHSEAADGWLQSIDKVFTVMQLTDEERVHHVPSFLFGTARIWWNAKCAPQQAMTWVDFCVAFEMEYGTAACSERKQLSFPALSQGSSSVAEYTHRFNGSCPSEADATPGEQARCASYRHGLRAEIGARIAGFQTVHFGALVEAERAEQGQVSFRGNDTKPARCSPPRMTRRADEDDQGPRERSYYQSGRTRAGVGCPTSGMSDELGAPRGVDAGGSRGCGEIGHLRRRCPRPGRAGSTEARPRVFQSQSRGHEHIPDGAMPGGSRGSFPASGPAGASAARRPHDARPGGSRSRAEEYAVVGMQREDVILPQVIDSNEEGRRCRLASSYYQRKTPGAEAGASAGDTFRMGLPVANSGAMLGLASRRNSSHASCPSAETRSWPVVRADRSRVGAKKDAVLEATPRAPLCSSSARPSCRSKKKLLILDLNGLLLDVASTIPDGYNPDIKLGSRGVFCRPFYLGFLMFCFERFDVAIWSSKMKKNVTKLVDCLFGDLKHKLLFCWDSSNCTETGFKTIENRQKGLVLKELRRIWENDDPGLDWDQRDYDETNTLLVDDSPYKALLNPVDTAIFPDTYHFQDVDDKFLGEGGDLRAYLERLVGVDNVERFVGRHRIGQDPITESNPHWPFYCQVIKSVNRM